MAKPASTPGGTYMLNHDISAERRLSLQYFMIIHQQDWLAYPSIEALLKEKPTLKIADLGTDNGFWALEIAECFPQAEVFGVEISDQQFPLIPLPRTKSEVLDPLEEGISSLV